MDLLQGTLELLVLRTLARGKLHGWGIGKQIQRQSRGVLEINQGSLYPALYRLEDRGLVRSEWGKATSGKRAKFYELTAAGRGQLVEERERWRLFSGAMERVLEG